MAEFEITVSEIAETVTGRDVWINYEYDTSFRLVENDDGSGKPPWYCVDEFPSYIVIADIPALIAALQRAQEIAAAWAAESEEA